MSALFAYGTLLFPQVLRVVAGRALASRPAMLDGFVRRGVVGELFPAIVEASERDRVLGVLYGGLVDREWRRLDRFEGELYQRRSVTVRCGDDDCGAFTYVLAPDWRHRLGAEPWDPSSFAREHLGAFVERIKRAGDPRAAE